MNRMYLFLVFLFLLSFSLNAQITIGSGFSPNSGALLDLKEEQTAGTSNSTKGLILPRVTMSTTMPKTNEMAQSIGGTEIWDETEHIGSVVYNAINTLDACTGGAHQGVYTWDGKKWYPLYLKKQAPPSAEISTDDYEGVNTYLRWIV